MARLFRDLKVEEADGKIRLNLYHRDGSAALTDVSVEISSEIVQQGDRWSAAAANCLLEIGEDGQPQLALTPEDIGAASEQDGVNLYTHKRSGTQHMLTGTGNNIRFAATADFAAGDTFLVNGTVCAAKTAAGDALWSGFFKSGAVVVCWRSGNNLTFNGGGLPGPQAAKLTPENIKSGVSVEVNGKKVDGVFTKDANAAAGDMRASKTAYVNGVKVTGALASRDTGTPNWCEYVRVYNGRFEIAPPAGIHGCYWDGGQYSYLNFDQVRTAIGLTSEKIVQGNNIVGVIGSTPPMNTGCPAYLCLGFTRSETNQVVSFGSLWYGSALFEGVDANHVRCKKSGSYEVVVVHRRTTDYNLSGTLTISIDGGRALGSATAGSNNWEIASLGTVNVNEGETLILRTTGENAWYEKCAIAIIWKG